MWVCVAREQVTRSLYEHLTRSSHDAVQPSTNSIDPVAWHLAWPFHPALPTLALTLIRSQTVKPQVLKSLCKERPLCLA